MLMWTRRRRKMKMSRCERMRTMSEIVRPVRRESASDAFYIVDAAKRCIADGITRQEWADEIVEALNKKETNEGN